MLQIFILLNLITINLYAFEQKPAVKSQEVSIPCGLLGYPKKSALKSLVARYLLKQSQVDSISIQTAKGGLYSEKLYIVTGKKNGKRTPLFFLKISNKAQSTDNLIKIQEGPIGQKFRNLKNLHENEAEISAKDLPIVIWLAIIFVYKDKHGVKRSIEVTPSAQGQLVQDVLDSEDRKMINKTAYAIGKSLASFHQLFMNYNDSQDVDVWRTVCHGDFSIRNTLFDPTTNKVYFIDNESMNRGPINYDLHAILTSFVMFKYIKRNYDTRWPLYLEYCTSLLQGYIESYPIDKRANVAAFIDEAIQASFEKSLSRRILSDRIGHGKKVSDKDFRKIIHQYLQKFKN